MYIEFDVEIKKSYLRDFTKITRFLGSVKIPNII